MTGATITAGDHNQLGLRIETEMRQRYEASSVVRCSIGRCAYSALTATAYAQQVKADTGGVAIGGSVTGSTINIGIPQAEGGRACS